MGAPQVRESGNQETGSKKQEAGSRKQEARSRRQEAGSKKQPDFLITDSLITVPIIPENPFLGKVIDIAVWPVIK
ncbi:MAG: hypothetical protein FJZ89_07560 [Chloroflexi bacterium]|nr:hypothetical protein [Chloroflexota bacterium]